MADRGRRKPEAQPPGRGVSSRLPSWVSQHWVAIAILEWEGGPDLLEPEPPSTTPKNDGI